jgi:uncharacterized membrane protein
MDPREESGGLEISLGHVLTYGTYVSMALVALGFILMIAGGISPLDPGPPLNLGTIASDLAAVRPAGFLWLGIIGVVGTPALRVIGALVGFSRRGERHMVLVAALILGVVALGVAAGVVTG